MSSGPRISRAVTKSVEAIRRKIASGEFLPGAVLPAETELSDEIIVCRGTIRKAIEILTASGELHRVPYSRPTISSRGLSANAEVCQPVPVWVSRPVSDGAVLAFLRGLSKGFRATHYRMVVREPSQYTGSIVKADQRRFFHDLISDQEFAGAVFWRDAFSKIDDLIYSVAATGKPLVFVDTPPPEKVHADYVGSANAFAARSCMEHLFQMGHRNVVFVADTVVPQTTRERIRGYRSAMTSAGISEFINVVVASEQHCSISINQPVDGPYARYTNVGGYFCDLAERAIQKVLAMKPIPTAIFANHDVLAANMCAVLNGAGIRIPEDIAVVGFDWLADCEKGFPDILTSAAQSFEGFGHHAASLLMDRLSGEITGPSRQVLLEAPLVIRSSTASDLTLPALEPARRFEGHFAFN